MAARSSSSSSSSSSETEQVTTGRLREISETSRDTLQTGSRLRTGSPTNTIDGTSIADTTTLRSASPTASHTSAAVSRTAYDSASVVTTNTAVTNVTTNSQQQPVLAGGIPIIRPPVLQNQQQSGTGVGVFGPQRPGGYPTQPPTTAGGFSSQQGIKIDVATAQQQYQQRNVQAEISPYSGSTSSSSGGSLSSPGNISTQQQTHFNASTAVYNQAGGQFQQQQQQQQQAQFANQIPAHQVYNELLGPDAFKDVILDIDYGALGGFNAAFQSGGDFAGSQLPPGITIRPAYTTVDSLSYQQHMFNTARTVHAEGDASAYDYGGASNNYNYGAASSNYNYDVTGGQQYNAGTGQHFDVAKAIFNQADSNRDGAISRDEFRQWAQGGQQNYGGQTYATSANYQTTAAAAANYGGVNDSFYQAGLVAGGDPSVANILQQSGLGQVIPNQ